VTLDVAGAGNVAEVTGGGTIPQAVPNPSPTPTLSASGEEAARRRRVMAGRYSSPRGVAAWRAGWGAAQVATPPPRPAWPLPPRVRRGVSSYGHCPSARRQTAPPPTVRRRMGSRHRTAIRARHSPAGRLPSRIWAYAAAGGAPAAGAPRAPRQGRGG
jgi:hypothetical protein